MTVLFAGGEGDALENLGSPQYTTTTSRYDTDAARIALQAEILDGWRAKFLRGADRWVHFSFVNEYDTLFNVNEVVVIRDSTLNQTIVRVIPDANIYYFEYWDGAAYQTIGGQLPFTSGRLVNVDIHCHVHGSSGSFAIYVDGVLHSELNGNTDLVPGAQADRVEFKAPDQFFSNSQRVSDFSEIIVADEPTVDWRCVTLWPEANGTHTAWVNDYTAIDEAQFDLNDVISSATAAQRESFTIRDIPTAFQDLDVYAVCVSSLSKKGSSGPSDMQHSVRTGGADFDSSNLGISSVAYGRFQTVWHTNPDTSLNWSHTEVNALEAGVESQA